MRLSPSEVETIHSTLTWRFGDAESVWLLELFKMNHRLPETHQT